MRIETGLEALTESGRFLSELQRELDGVLRGPTERLGYLTLLGPALLDQVNRLLQAGGKRVRPTLMHAAYLAAGGRGGEDLPAGVALELLHTFALLQDDVMDGARLRRGRPTASAHFESLGLASAPGGISGAQSLAILASDLALILAEESFQRLAIPPDRLALARHYWEHLRLELAAGQALDIALTGQAPWESSQVLQVADLKSGRYTVLRPLQIGAAIAGWSGVLIERWTTAALPIGIAFQIQDDLLALVASTEETGKEGLEDIRAGKATLPMALAFERANPAQRERLQQIVGNPAATPEEGAEVREILQATGALQYARWMVNQMLRAGKAKLEQLPLDRIGRELLDGLLLQLSARRH